MAAFDTDLSMANHVCAGPALKMGEEGPPNSWHIRKREFARLIGDDLRDVVVASRQGTAEEPRDACSIWLK